MTTRVGCYLPRGLSKLSSMCTVDTYLCAASYVSEFKKDRLVFVRLGLVVNDMCIVGIKHRGLCKATRVIAPRVLYGIPTVRGEFDPQQICSPRRTE